MDIKVEQLQDKQYPCSAVDGKVGKHIKNDGGLSYSRITDHHIVHSLRKSLVTAQQFIHYLPRPPVLEKSFLEPDISHSYNVPYHNSSTFALSVRILLIQPYIIILPLNPTAKLKDTIAKQWQES